MRAPGELTKMGRGFWWVIAIVCGFDSVLNGWALVHDRAQWHPDVAVISTLTMIVAFYKIGRDADAR